MIELRDISKSYAMGDATVHALREVSLTIAEGDFVAIMGPSGSGKSTLLHLLGLLDTPDAGSYTIFDHETAQLHEDELAILRRSVIGFVFQQFHLLPRLTALENVALPQIYAGRKCDVARAIELLNRMGLQARHLHRPNELSGGQQQRVAIARSLINAPRMILADEPTGNLDSTSAREILDTLQALNQEGITIVMVTHEEAIARKAKRLIRMLDGRIQSDERVAPLPGPSTTPAPDLSMHSGSALSPSEIADHLHQGFITLAANKVRTGLSLLGILIGVTAVVAVLALGAGAREAIQKQLSSLGSNLLMLRSGAVHMGGVVLETGAATRLTLEDAESIRENIPSIVEAAPTLQGRGQVAFRDRNWNTQIMGTAPAYAEMRAATPEIGRFFTEEENRNRTLVCLIGMTVARELFGEENPVGETIKINKINFRVIGVLPEKGATGWRDQDDVIVVPVLTAMYRLFGRDYVDSLDLQVSDISEIAEAQRAAMDLMITRHRVPPSQRQDAFQIRNMSDIKATMEESSRTMSTLLSAIAAISLLVGGIGIMNIMLVSVTERTREIGLRKAIGARPLDILAQFLAESVVVSAVGGILGVMIGALITIILSRLAGWTTTITASSIFLAFGFSAAIGVIFGIYPAQRASRLNPIEALRYE